MSNNEQLVRNAVSTIQYTACVNETCNNIPMLFIQPSKHKVTIKCQCSDIPYTLTPMQYIYVLNNRMLNKICKYTREHFYMKYKGIEYCYNCDVWLCNECICVHENVRELYNHQRSTLLPQTYCSKHHKENLNYYCNDCPVNMNYLCKNCLCSHPKAHNVMQLDTSILTSSQFNAIKKDFIAIKMRINAFRNVIIQHIQEYPTETDSLQNAYDTFVDNALSVLTLVELMITTYYQYKTNYNVLMNLITNTNFITHSNNDNGGILLLSLCKQNIPRIINTCVHMNIIKEGKRTFNDDTQLHKGNIRIIDSIKSHSDFIYSLLLYNVNTIISCSCDGAINIYTLTTSDSDNNCKLQYDFSIPKAHREDYVNSGSVISISKLHSNNDDYLLSCGSDARIKIWKLHFPSKTYELLHILCGHTKTVTNAFVINNKHIISSSFDESIRIWSNTFPYTHVTSLLHFNNPVHAVLLLNNKHTLLSCGGRLICFWNMLTYQCETVINGVYCSNNNALTQLEHANNLIAVGGHEMIYLICPREFMVVKKIYSQYFAYADISAFATVNNALYVCSSKGNVCKLSLHDYSFTFTNAKLHNDWIRCVIAVSISPTTVQHASTLFATCSDDCSVKLWKEM
jgi:WD40 repeat protein